MSSRIRPGAYKKSLVSEEQCSTWSRDFSLRFKEALSQTNVASLSEAEFASLYVQVGLMTLRPLDWRGGAHNGFDHTLTISSFINLYLNHSLRSIPISVNRSLYYWFTEKYPLKLYLEVPTSLEVLKMQTLGYRCVSCITDESLTQKYILEERDALSFALHDLIHADHFFKHPDWKNAQIGFSRWMLELYEDQSFNQWLCNDPVFAKDFFYGSSDMNSHPAHMMKYFKYIMAAALLRKNNHPQTSSLSKNEQQELEHWIRKTSAIGGFNDDFLQNFLFLNLPSENVDVLKTLSEQLELKFIEDKAGRYSEKTQTSETPSFVFN